MNRFGQLKKFALSEFWPHDETKFTQWLAANIDVLNNVLHLKLELIENTSSISADSSIILAQDIHSLDTIIIQSQVDNTGYTHFGELITQAAEFNVSKIVWIADGIETKHKKAIDWLNQNTHANILFIALTVEILQIDDSKPAIHFISAVAPKKNILNTEPETQTAPSRTTTWQETATGDEELNEKVGSIGSLSKFEKYNIYYKALVDELREKYQFTNETKGRPQNWYSFSSGIHGIVYSAAFGHDGRVRAEICFDHAEKEKNKELFDYLKSKQKEINSQYGSPLEWERLSDKRISRIAIYQDGVIEASDSELEEIRQWHIENLLKLKTLFSLEIQKHLRELK